MKTMLHVFAYILLFQTAGFANRVPFDPGPDFSADITQGCGPLTVQFTDNTVSNPADPIVVWRWEFGDGTSSTLSFPSHTYTSDGTYSVKLIVTTQSGAKDSVTRANYIQVGLLVNLGNDTSICEGDAIVLDAGNPGATYLWSTGQTTRKIFAENEGQYHVTVTKDGCVKKDTMRLFFRPSSTPNFGFEIQNNCLPSSVKFTDSSTSCSGYSITQWLWEFGDGTTSTLQNPVHTYLTEGSFTVRLTIRDDGGLQIRKSRRVEISNDLAGVDLGPDTFFCNGASIILDAGVTGATYLWNTGETQQQIETFFAGEYSVEVTKGGCVGKDTVYVDTRPPLFADFVYVESATCLPSAVEFTDVSQTCTGAIVGWEWDFGDGGTSSQRNPSHVYTTSGMFDVTLTITASNGSVITITKQVEILALPGPSVELGSDTTLCEGSTLLLDAGNAGASILWSTGETTTSINVVDAGKYYVTIENNGCIATDTINVSVTPSLFPNFGVAQTNNCSSVTVTFTDSSSSCNGTISQWQWDFGDGTTSTSQNPQHNYPAAGEYNVRLTITDNNGNSISRGRRVVIAGLVQPVDLGSDTTMCFGNILTLDAGNAGSTYLWSTGETTQQIEVLDDGTYWVRVTNGGCIVTDTIAVTTVFPVQATWDYEIASTCLPVVVQFTDESTVTCGQSIIKWEWAFGDGGTSLERSPAHTYMTSDSFLVRLTVTTSGGRVVSRSRKIYIANTPLAVDLQETLEVCKNETILLDAGVDDATYAWTPSAAFDNPASRQPRLVARTSGWYKVGVSRCLLTVSDSFYVSVQDVKKPIIRKDGNIIVSITEGGRYQWYRDGAPIPNGDQPTLKPGKKGFYHLRVYNSLGCWNESDSLFFVAASSRDKEIDGLRIKLTPNPSRGLVMILISGEISKKIRIDVVDQYGKRLFNTQTSGHVTTIDMRRYPAGTYYFEFVIDRKKQVVPLILK
jgi:PKD repeat protein